MGGRSISATPEARERTAAGGTPHSASAPPDSPGLRLLDALRSGDDLGVLEFCGPTTTFSAENMPWSCLGREQVQLMLIEVRERFPGLTYESRTRLVGFGVVVEEARVRDVQPEVATDVVVPDEEGEPAKGSDHPMYDDPVFAAQLAHGATTTTRELTLWRDRGGDEPPAPLNMPVRVTVRHDDLQVHEVSFSFPAALLRRALGERVDPFELSLSEVQSAFVAPAEAELSTRAMDLPGPAATPGEADARQRHDDVVVSRRPRRRRRWLRMLLVVLALVAAGAWWAVDGRGAMGAHTPSVAPPAAPSATLPTTTVSVPSVSASPSPSVTASPARGASLTLRSDLAFGFDSARLSPAARDAIDDVARRVVGSGLHGRIYVDGYTDSIGSAAYGVQLSQRRADAVSSYLRSRLTHAPVSIVPTGHGEADPVADNATAAGRQANRRVTITLPSR